MSSLKSYITTFFTQKSYIDVFFMPFSVKMCVTSVNFSDSFIILGLLGYKTYMHWMSTKPLLNVDEELRKEIGDMKSVMAAMGMRSGIKQQAEPPRKLF